MNAAHIEERILKGGSLNRTSRLIFPDGRSIIRKSISRTENREYGFVRWYSQFKRMQRYNRIFPGLFPDLISAGVNDIGAYFDMEFIDGCVDIKQYLSTPLPDDAIERLHARLWSAMDTMHDHTSFDTYAGSLALYFEEEVVQRLNDAMGHAAFRDFCKRDEIVLNGKPQCGLLRNLDWLAKAFAGARVDKECYTHGNITLENLLYVPAADRIVFIDPYEENVIDCREAEYSQILQCSNQLYGYINDRGVRVSGAEVSFEGDIPRAFGVFNDLFGRELKRRLSDEQHLTVRLLEASQFTRMLPFKVLAGQVEKAMYFYGVACRLVQSLRQESRT